MDNLNDDFRRFLIFLSMFDNTYTKNQQIIECMGDDFTLKHFNRLKLEEVVNEILASNMKAWAKDEVIENYLESLEDRDIKLITKFDGDFPSKLKVLPDCPMFLFCKGDLSLLNKKALAIVGTRKPSPYGRVVTERISRDVAGAGIVIVSGLAYGVDSIAHRKCLEVGGKTIAVLGSGFDRIYPSEHKGLADEIAKSGLLVSEYSPDKQATKFSFPTRNRIIAGISDGVLITEANIRSGTIHTKDYALEYNRAIYAVPGNIDSQTSGLTNDIIKKGQARCVTEPRDILDDFDIEEGSKPKQYQLSMDEQAIVNLLQDGMKEIDYLTKNCGLTINNFNSNLTMLEIRGIITRLPGGLVSLN